MDSRLTAALRRLRRRLFWHRQVLAASCAAIAVICAVGAIRQPEPGATVTVAARDLPAGHVLTAADMTTARVPLASVPDQSVGAPAALIGERLALPIGQRELITMTRVLDRSLLNALGNSLSAIPIGIDDAGAAIVEAGSVIDVYAPTDAGTSLLVATEVRVLTVLDGGEARVAVVAADRAAVARLTGAGAGPMAIALRLPP